MINIKSLKRYGLNVYVKEKKTDRSCYVNIRILDYQSIFISTHLTCRYFHAQATSYDININ